MIMEFIVGGICVAFIVLVVFLIITLQKVRKLMKKADRVLTEAHITMHTLSEPSLTLVENANDLIVDIKEKSEGLDVLFRPLYTMKKEKSHTKNSYEKISEIMECVAEGVRLFSKIKNEIK